ncbi:hypothetical protein Golob_027395 [Gossypium lobatum]|uniref:Uncharacterized protein n=1 Tax=Gossypium lobatum TaxID=34289 RepID=A0A7J8NFM5_9ROSI|nr:hypothetical protein [Gossypium lobatum]
MFNLLKKKTVPKKLWKNLVLLFQPKVKIKRLTKSQNRNKRPFINHTAYVEETEFFNNNDEIWEDPSDEEGIPLSKEVDVKAEEFINRCKEIWRLERQKSEEEFRERLARSA